MEEQTLISRTGGAPTLALGMSQIFTEAFGGGLAAFWYHFAIMFEALFILTAVDAGTRVGRFMLQDTVGNVWPRYADLSWKPASWSASAVVVGLWGYMLYVGVTDPLGGINQLFPLFGISNQLLAAIALTLCVTLLIKHGKAKWAWVPGIGLAWDLIVTMTASYQKVFSDNPKPSATSPSASATRTPWTPASCSPPRPASTRWSRWSSTRRSTAPCRRSSRSWCSWWSPTPSSSGSGRCAPAACRPPRCRGRSPTSSQPSDFLATAEEKEAVREWETTGRGTGVGRHR